MLTSFKKVLASAWETLEVVLIAVITVFLIRTFLIQPFVVSGASMEPNFSDGNYLLIDEITYRFREPLRGEVVVFEYPLNPELFFIKRVIGMPGEHVSYDNGKVRISDGDKTVVIDEAYLHLGDKVVDFFDDITLEDDQYFVLGDNRYKSFDSRNWGSVTRDEIVGIARLRIFPLSNFRIFEAPVY